MPYLARTLGVGNFGLLGIVSAVMGYASLITDWGFGFTATREVARNATNLAALRKIYWNTFFAKALLCSCALVVFIGAASTIPDWRKMLSDIIGFLVCADNGRFKRRVVFAGLRNIVGFAKISLVSRLSAIPLIFALVHSPEDVIVVAAISGGIGLISAMLSLLVANRAVPLFPAHFDVRETDQQIKSGASIFLATGGISLYTQSNLILIGMIAGPVQAGLYSGAEKIQRALTALIGPVSVAVYPRINNLLVSSPSQSHKLMRITLILQGLFTLCLSIGMFLSADIATRLLLGEQYAGAIPIIRWLAALPFLIGLSNAIGVNMMFPLGLNAEVARVTVASGILNVGLLSALTYFEGALGAAIAVVVTEAFVTLGFALVVYAKRKIIFQIDKA